MELLDFTKSGATADSGRKCVFWQPKAKPCPAIGVGPMALLAGLGSSKTLTFLDFRSRKPPKFLKVQEMHLQRALSGSARSVSRSAWLSQGPPGCRCPRRHLQALPIAHGQLPRRSCLKRHLRAAGPGSARTAGVAYLGTHHCIIIVAVLQSRGQSCQAPAPQKGSRTSYARTDRVRRGSSARTQPPSTQRTSMIRRGSKSI